MDLLPLNVRTTPSRSRREHNNRRSELMSVYAGVDTRLRPRVCQYLATIQGHFHMDSMVDDLRKTYIEYSRKKRSSFKLSVIKAYNAHCRDQDAKNSRNSSDGNSSEVFLGESDFSENDSFGSLEDKNGANNSLRDLYSSATSAKTITTPVSTGTSVRKAQRVAKKSPKETVKAEETPRIPDQSVSIEVETVGQKKKKRRLEGEHKRINGEILDIKAKNKDREFLPQKSNVNFSDVGGNEKCLEEVVKMLVHLKHPEVYVKLGVQPPRGLLLHGPPGCGKTLLAHAIAGELDVPFIRAAATEVVSGVSGESEERLRDLFARAVSSAPCILFIDEVDAITPKRETAQREMERRIVAQLLICMDDLNAKDAAAQVLVIGATNRPDSLDPALRRAGRFDRELCMGIPDEAARNRILKVLCRKLRLQSDFDYDYVAKNTPGYVGADLMALAREAAMCAINRVFQILQSQNKLRENPNVASSIDLSAMVVQKETTNIELSLSWLRDQPPLNEQQLQDLFVEMRDFQDALKFVQPSAKREGFATVPDVTWDDVGALGEVREELQLAILAPVRHPEKFKILGLSNPAGILLCGPPGCGKTMLAKAVANESGVNFISVKGPELLNMYVGESERAVRQCFQRARNSAPCVIFFDELDALCPKRSDSAEGSASSRVVNQLLTEMDGLDSRKDVFILGATNRADIIDPAVIRPGRLDKVLYVGLPTAEDRVDILKTITKIGTKPCLDIDLCLREVGYDPRCNGFTGADLSALVREASVSALKESINEVTVDVNIRVGKRHFEEAFSKVRLSVSPKDQRMYDRMKREFTRGGTKGFDSEAKQTTPVNLDQ